MGKGGEEWEEQTNVCSNANCMWPGPFYFLSGMHNDDDLTDATHTIGYCVGLVRWVTEVAFACQRGGACQPCLGVGSLELELVVLGLLACRKQPFSRWEWRLEDEIRCIKGRGKGEKRVKVGEGAYRCKMRAARRVT
jgi:hypothetical protein